MIEIESENKVFMIQLKKGANLHVWLILFNVLFCIMLSVSY